MRETVESGAELGLKAESTEPLTLNITCPTSLHVRDLEPVIGENEPVAALILDIDV